MAAKSAETESKVIKVEVYYIPDEKLGEIWIKAHMGDVSGFLDVSELKLVDQPGFRRHTDRANHHPRNLETIYKHYQAIDGSNHERTSQLKVRSMSVGDAIVVDGETYYVASEGFVKKEKNTLVPVTE